MFIVVAGTFILYCASQSMSCRILYLLAYLLSPAVPRLPCALPHARYPPPLCSAFLRLKSISIRPVRFKAPPPASSRSYLFRYLEVPCRCPRGMQPASPSFSQAGAWGGPSLGRPGHLPACCIYPLPGSLLAQNSSVILKSRAEVHRGFNQLLPGWEPGAARALSHLLYPLPGGGGVSPAVSLMELSRCFRSQGALFLPLSF